MTTTTSNPNWDPLPNEREYVRSSRTGDRGYLVRREGKDVVRLDRPMQELLFPKGPEWVADEFGSLLLESQVAHICFAADRAICGAVGLHMESRKGWQDLSDAERLKFLGDGPPRTQVVRGVVYDAIKAAMKPYTRD